MKRIALAYSGGLDTSVIASYLQEENPGASIIGVCVNVGQQEDWNVARKRAKNSGIEKLYIVDAREQFICDFLFPILRAGARYEQRYLLGTAIARPLQAAHQARIALSEQADALAHGCTGKGNDQVRFELTYRALAPHLAIIAPWRTWSIRSRLDAIEYARKRGLDLGEISAENIYSRDWNIWHMSHEGGDLEALTNRPDESLFRLTNSPQNAPDRERKVTIDFGHGTPIAIDGKAMSAIDMMTTLNKIAGENAIGRADIVETRIVGMKSRGIYESPGGELLYQALSALEEICLSHAMLNTKKILSRQYADIIYQGHWFSPLRESLDAFFESSSKALCGSVTLALYKGNATIVSRKAERSLYNQEIASFDAGSYDHADAGGFIRLYGLATDLSANAYPQQRLSENFTEELFHYA